MWPFYVAHIKSCEIKKDLDGSLRLKKISRMGHEYMKEMKKKEKQSERHKHPTVHYGCFKL